MKLKVNNSAIKMLFDKYVSINIVVGIANKKNYAYATTPTKLKMLTQ